MPPAPSKCPPLSVSPSANARAFAPLPPLTAIGTPTESSVTVQALGRVVAEVDREAVRRMREGRGLERAGAAAQLRHRGLVAGVVLEHASGCRRRPAGRRRRGRSPVPSQDERLEVAKRDPRAVEHDRRRRARAPGRSRRERHATRGRSARRRSRARRPRRPPRAPPSKTRPSGAGLPPVKSMRSVSLPAVPAIDERPAARAPPGAATTRPRSSSRTSPPLAAQRQDAFADVAGARGEPQCRGRTAARLRG